MANQTVIEELALTLGLDLTQFEKDYAAASKQVTAATQKLNRDMRLEKLRMDIDSSKFAGAEKKDILDTIDKIYSFRNEYIAHQEKELDDMNTAKEAIDDWIKGLIQISGSIE